MDALVRAWQVSMPCRGCNSIRNESEQRFAQFWRYAEDEIDIDETHLELPISFGRVTWQGLFDPQPKPLPSP